MPALSSAERSKRWRDRQKASPNKHARYLQQERERYKKRKTEGSITSIAEKTEREKRQVRKQWRKHQNAKRRKEQNLLRLIREQTPPLSPVLMMQSTQQKRGRQKVRKDRAKCYRENKILKVKLKEANRKYDRYRKRESRWQSKVQSPRSEARNLLRGQNVTEKVRKTLEYHKVLVAGIKEKYQNTKSEKKRQLIANSVKSSYMRKYRLGKMTTETFGFSPKRLKIGLTNTSESLEYVRKPKLKRVTEQLQNKVKNFLERDDCSRIKAGKKETITRLKIKKQKRLLNDSMKNLHKKFLSENTDTKVSYSMFCRLRPFWVIAPSIADRDTCMCKVHDNLDLKANKLHKQKIIATSDLETLCSGVCCSTDNKVCMYRECKDCKHKTVKMLDFDPGTQISWEKWVSRRKEIEKKIPGGDKKPVIITVTEKSVECGTHEHLAQEFDSDLKKACRHIYNIRHQYRALRDLREHLSAEEAVVHMDFSENYLCKYNKEIQSIHFGANQRQVTLHTGIVYTHKDNIPFCTVSDSLKHSPPAIWAHVSPVLSSVINRAEDPIKTIHFISDGPTTQYRSKGNFYLFSTLIHELNFTEAYWNFLEAGHGKGPADGIGAVAKRTADRLVALGKDIRNAETLMKVLEDNTSLMLSLIDERDIEKIESRLPTDLQTIPNTMKLHQLYTKSPAEIFARFLSCYCAGNSSGTLCKCYSPLKYQFPHDQGPPEDTSQLPSHPSTSEPTSHPPSENASYMCLAV